MTYHPGDDKALEVWYLVGSSGSSGGGDDDDDDDCDDDDRDGRDGDDDDDEDDDGDSAPRGPRTRGSSGPSSADVGARPCGGDHDDDDDDDDDDDEDDDDCGGGGGQPLGPVSLGAVTTAFCSSFATPPTASWVHPGAIGANGLLVVSVNFDRLLVEVLSVAWAPSPSGTDGTITVTFNAGAVAVCTSASFDNVDQAAPLVRLSESTGTHSEGVSDTVISSADNMVYDLIGLSSITGSCRIPNVGLSQELQHDIPDADAGSQNCFATDGSNATGAPSVSLSWSWAPLFNYYYAHVIYDINAGVAAAPPCDDDDDDDDDDDEDD